MNNNKLLVCFFIAFAQFSGLSYAQNFEWAVSAGSTKSDYSESIAIDNDGNVYTTGSFEGTVDFDPGSGTRNLTSNGSQDIFVQKLDSKGKLVWAHSFGGTLADYGYAITIDQKGDCYVTGTYQGTADFDPGSGTKNLTSSGSVDIFLLKLNSSGALIRALSFGSTSSGDYGRGLTTDRNNNLLLTGSFGGTVDFDPGSSTYNLTSKSGQDILILKLDSQGNFIWAKGMGGNLGCWGNSITTDYNGNVYSAGLFQGTANVDFDPGSGTYNVMPYGVYGGDAYIHKLTASGKFAWVKVIAASLTEYASCVKADAFGNVYTVGYFSSFSCDFNTGSGTYTLLTKGSEDIFLHKMDTAGNYKWAVSMGGTSNDFCNSVDVDKSGDVYITGAFRSTVDFDPGSSVYNLTAKSSPGADIYIEKLDSNGKFISVIPIGSSKHDFSQAICVDKYKKIYINGGFEDSADFDPGSGVSKLYNSGGYDVFVAKFNQCAPDSGTDVQVACDSFKWIDGKTYTASNNTAKYALTNVLGCDSVVSLKLTIKKSTYGTDTRIACDSFSWIDGKTYFSSNDSAIFKVKNVAGCDSIITLKLTINKSNTGIDTHIACDSFSWIDGKTYYASNTTATYLLKNTTGCDSVVTLNLTVNKSDKSTDTHVACDSFTWMDGKTYYASNTTATYLMKKTSGCDSVITLNLTVNKSDKSMDTHVACDSFKWIDGNIYYTSNTTATYLLKNVKGCDSLITLNLTIHSVSDITTTLVDKTITANNNKATYQWLNCDNNYAAIAGEKSQSFTPGSSGNYAVELTENGCVDTSECVEVNTIGTINISGKSFRIFPNPTSGNLSIDLGKHFQNISVSICDMNGKILQSETFLQAQNLQFSLHVGTGIYIIIVQADDEKSVSRFISE